MIERFDAVLTVSVADMYDIVHLNLKLTEAEINFLRSIVLRFHTEADRCQSDLIMGIRARTFQSTEQEAAK